MARQWMISASLVSALALAGCGGSGSSGDARDNVRAVGSSTLYPFATAISEAEAKANGTKAAVVESTGTGAGMKLFCAGVGVAHPDIENASRRMKKSEYEECAKNGVKDIVEIQVGLDGIAFGQAKAGPKMALTPLDVYKALAAEPFGKPNTAKNWSDVNPTLPVMPISVYGPPSTSGTRDALAELILTKGCDTDPAMKALKEKDKEAHKKVCTTVRTDGAFIEGNENDNLLVQKIAANNKAIAIFGFSYLEENMATVQGITMSGIAPTYATISDFSYPGARPLFIYVKAAHLNGVKGLKPYVAQWVKSWDPDGPLKAKGMIVAPDDIRKKSAAIAAGMTLLDPATLN